MIQLHQFVDRNRSDWRRLEALLDKAERDVQSLTDEDLDALGRLYRQATSDLALAQRDFSGHRVTRYLNDLVARAHAVIYGKRAFRTLGVWRFFTHAYPEVYRRLWPYTLSAFLVFIVPAIIAFFAVLRNPEAILVMMGPGARDLMETVKAGKLWTDIQPEVRTFASAFILTHNIQVMFLTFAGGVTAGLLTVYALIVNGMDIGAVFGLLHAHGMSGQLAEFVIAHGVIELSVIFLSGGVGLYVGDGLLRPGLQSRRDVLVDRARMGVIAILGSIPLLVVAGLIEGFISPSRAPWWVKAAVGVASGILLYGYWWRAGR